ncbi:hypothetical protein AVEN_61354-1 [Araneus ventricosus]|uniref:Uncharacterized protein n=1 Tax=Araneus ventricosus TaxID=182803 RepID=A0A4Y2MV70_ARAVE|nr:hypothetical protein AVEN_61354-1 [Araneus ventricosus]
MENATRKETENPALINECVEKNFAFLKSLPNSLPTIFHLVVFQRTKRELRVTLRNKIESRVTRGNKRELSTETRESRVNFEEQEGIT